MRTGAEVSQWHTMLPFAAEQSFSLPSFTFRTIFPSPMKAEICHINGGTVSSISQKIKTNYLSNDKPK